MFDSVDEADLAPVLDVAFGGGIGDAEAGGVFQKGLCAESEWKTPEELLLAIGALGGGFGEVGAGELAIDADGVVDEHAGDGHCGVEVFIVADECADFLAGVAEPERGEDHRDAEGDEAQAPDWLPPQGLVKISYIRLRRHWMRFPSSSLRCMPPPRQYFQWGQAAHSSVYIQERSR